MTHPLIVSGVISCAANLLTGWFVYSRNPRSRVNILFALFSVAVSGWSVGSFLENVIPDKGLALHVLRWNYLFAVWLPPLYLHFVYALSPLTVARKSILQTAYSFSAFLSPFVLTPVFIQGLRLLQTQPYPFFISSPGPVYYLFFIFFGVSVGEVLRATVSGRRQSEGERRTQFTYLTVANTMAIAAGFEYFSRVFGLLKSPPLDDYILMCYLAVIAYAIVRHQLMDIRVVIRRSLVYSLLICCITALYLVMVLMLEKGFQGFFGYRSLVATIFVAFLIAIFFNPLRQRIQTFVDRAVFKATPAELAIQREGLLVELQKTDQMKSVALLASGLAHEIKHPLTSLKTFVEYLPKKGADPTFREMFYRIATTELTHLNEIVRSLLDFSKPTTMHVEPTSVSHLLYETLELLSSECLKRGVHVEHTFRTQEPVAADPKQLRQVFLNLLLNSLEAMEDGGTLSVATAHADHQVMVTIHDTGDGIPRQHLTRIFEPFFTTKPKGTGLGLSIVRGIVTEHGGTIAFDSEVHQGTRCTVTFPVSKDSDQEQPCHPAVEHQS